MLFPGHQRVAEPFEVCLELKNGTALVRLAGEFDSSCRKELEERLVQAAQAGPDEIILDLRQLESISSPGLRFLLEVWNLSRGGGFDSAVLPAEGAVRLLFEKTELDQVLPIRTS